MELVIFDLDGVIVSTDHYHFKAWQELAIQHNLHFDQNINQNLRGVSRGESLEIILKHNDTTVTPQVFDQMLEEKNTVYKSLLTNLTRADILPGVLELIKSLKQNNIKIAIGSSSKNTPLILERIGLSEVFDAVIDGNMISKSKPNPEVFVKSSNFLNKPYTECIVIEDAVAGIEAAKACGMKTVGVGLHELQADVHFNTLENITYDILNDTIGGFYA